MTELDNPVRCLCGARPLTSGHTKDCPYPYYGDRIDENARWTAARDRKRAKLLTVTPECIAEEGLCSNRHCCDCAEETGE